VLKCPFCGADETDRFDLDGQRFLVFACMFTPAVDPRWDERELAEHLVTAYPPDASGAYFRRMCDRLHLYVTKGEREHVPADDPSSPAASGGP
jgi:hypothetical protein